MSKCKEKCIDFRTWLNHNKISSSEPLIADIRTILDKATFRYTKIGGFSLDDILVRMKEDGWVYEDDTQQTELGFDTFFDMLESNPLAEWYQEHLMQKGENRY